MNITDIDPETVMQSLMGHQMVDWGRDDTMYHITLDDGRILIFMALGIATWPDRAVH